MANIITLARICLAALLAAALLLDVAWGAKAAFIIFVIASASDFIDGAIARARSETSALGAALDPLADKVLVATALILLIRSGAIHGAAVVAALIIVLREILVSGLREAVAKTGGDMPVTMLAKWKTTAQLAALGVLIAAAPGGFADPAWRPAGIALLWFAAILTAWTAISYTRTAVDRLNRIDGGRD